MPTPVKRVPRRVADVAVPLVVAAYLAMVVLGSPAHSNGWLRLLGVLAAVGQGAALWWRRTRMVAVMLVALAGGLVVQAIAPDGVFPVAGLVALGSLAAVRPPRVSVPALVALLGLTATNFWTTAAGDAGFAMAFPVVVWALGEAVRNRRSAIDQASRRAAGDEQARIAREVHDVIAHSVSVIVVQAAAADDVFDASPGQARAALRSIEATGREALDELRTLLGAVRPPPRDSTDDDPAAQRRPGLAQLADLTRPLRAAGLTVTVDAQTCALSTDLDLTAYRIVQEALTNTLRHAGARTAQVTVRAAAGRLDLEIVDDGTGRAAAPGRGIRGMRERAAMVGGALEAAPGPAGGFRVHASLPLAAT